MHQRWRFHPENRGDRLHLLEQPRNPRDPQKQHRQGREGAVRHERAVGRKLPSKPHDHGESDTDDEHGRQIVQPQGQRRSDHQREPRQRRRGRSSGVTGSVACAPQTEQRQARGAGMAHQPCRAAKRDGHGKGHGHGRAGFLRVLDVDRGKGEDQAGAEANPGAVAPAADDAAEAVDRGRASDAEDRRKRAQRHFVVAEHPPETEHRVVDGRMRFERRHERPQGFERLPRKPEAVRLVQPQRQLADLVETQETGKGRHQKKRRDRSQGRRHGPSIRRHGRRSLPGAGPGGRKSDSRGSSWL